MSIIDLIAELLDDSEALSSKEKALGIWEVIESSGRYLTVCENCTLWTFDGVPLCGHDNKFLYYVLLEMPQYDREERKDERAYVSELMALFPKKKEEGKKK